MTQPIKTVGQLRQILTQCNDDQPIEAFYSQYNGSEDEVEYLPLRVYLSVDDRLLVVPDDISAIRDRDQSGSIEVLS